MFFCILWIAQENIRLARDSTSHHGEWHVGARRARRVYQQGETKGRERRQPSMRNRSTSSSTPACWLGPRALTKPRWRRRGGRRTRRQTTRRGRPTPASPLRGERRIARRGRCAAPRASRSRAGWAARRAAAAPPTSATAAAAGSPTCAGPARPANP